MSLSISEKLEQGPMFDMPIIEHHFTPYMRDYDVIVDLIEPVPNKSHSYVEGRYRYRFNHCVIADVKTAIRDENWINSWDDIFLNFAAWEAADYPSGYVWDVRWQNAYPGLSYIRDSGVAQEWSERLNKPMHEVCIEADAHNIRLIFHDVTITKIAQGFPESPDLVFIENDAESDAV